MSTLKIELSNIYNIDKFYLWTDSTIVFCWIRNTHKEYKTFVHNRVCEIRNLSKFGVWKLIPDIISKGCAPNFLVSNSLWFNGPEFLNLPEIHWPQLSPGNKFSEDPEEKTVNDNARIKSIVNHVTVSRDQIINENKNDNIDIQDNNVSVNNSRLIRVMDLNKIIDIHRYNTLNKLVRVTAWVRRFIRNMKKKKEEKKTSLIKQGKLTILKLLKLPKIR